MYNLPKFLENINSRNIPFQGQYRFDEPMADHTSFKTGGPAGLWIRPEGDCFPEYAALLLESARNEGIPVFILGGGANILVSDMGIEGIVLDTTGYCVPQKQFPGSNGILRFKAGMSADFAAEYAAGHGFSGLEFLAGMPGSVGGALWMNARCYDREVADVVTEVQVLENGVFKVYSVKKEDFSYKKSPFQAWDCLILSGSFILQERDPVQIKKEMETFRKDREAKGHYRLPSAGSVFKNTRAFVKPVGVIIDELRLKGLSIGDAQIAPWHGNIIVNRGKARTKEILSLIELLENRVKMELGLVLEREVIFIGK